MATGSSYRALSKSTATFAKATLPTGCLQPMTECVEDTGNPSWEVQGCSNGPPGLKDPRGFAEPPQTTGQSWILSPKLPSFSPSLGVRPALCLLAPPAPFQFSLQGVSLNKIFAHLVLLASASWGPKLTQPSVGTSG